MSQQKQTQKQQPAVDIHVERQEGEQEETEEERQQRLEEYYKKKGVPLAMLKDRVVTWVPIPPFEPIEQDEAFVDIVAETRSRRKMQQQHEQGDEGDEQQQQQDDSYSSDGEINVHQEIVSDNNNNNNTNNNRQEEEEEGENSPGINIDSNSNLILTKTSLASSARAQHYRQFSSSKYWPYPVTSGLREVLDRTDLNDRPHHHRLPNAARLREHFKEGGRLSIEDTLWIINLASSVFLDEPNVVDIKSPVTVCGDTHGQFYDFLSLLELGGDPTSTQYLFMGDYVDRGVFSTEITLTLLAYKIMNPTQMWLLRGNHECRHLTAYFNFKTECLKKYNESVYDAFMNCFDTLPLAARVDGRFLCVHGGIGPDIKSVEDIQLIQRVCEPPPRGPMCDLLWADPMEPDEESAAPGARFLYNDIRSCSYSFSYKATTEFLRANNLLSLIRAHESQFEGYRMFQKVPETGMPSVICVFSAPNYCEYNNKAAIMLLDGHTLKIRQFAAVEHPYVLQNFLNAFSWSMPFLADKCQNVCSEVSGLSCYEASSSSSSPTSSASSSSSSPTSAKEKEKEKQSKKPTNSENCKHGTAERPLHGVLGNAQGLLLAAAALAHSSKRSFLNRCFYLLPSFLRRRGPVVLIKIRAVVWFIRCNARKNINNTAANSSSSNNSSNASASTRNSKASTAPTTTAAAVAGGGGAGGGNNSSSSTHADPNLLLVGSGSGEMDDNKEEAEEQQGEGAKTLEE